MTVLGGTDTKLKSSKIEILIKIANYPRSTKMRRLRIVNKGREKVQTMSHLSETQAWEKEVIEYHTLNKMTRSK